MKKKIMVMTLIAIFVLTIPLIGTAQACRFRRRPVEKIPVTTSSGAMLSMTDPTRTWTICDKYELDVGVTSKTETTLHLPDEDLEGIGDNSNTFRILNLETEVRTVFTNKVVWTFPTGTFEGRIIFKYTNALSPPPTWDVTIIYCVLRGTGAFEGQTLVLDYDGPFIGAVWTGFIYKR